jgi:hypothetical protein
MMGFAHHAVKLIASVLCITVTVMVGFQYILNVCLLSVFMIARSRKFILLLTSVSNMTFNFRCTLLILV